MMIAFILLAAAAAEPAFPPDPAAPAVDAAPLSPGADPEDRRPRLSLGPGLFPAEPGPGHNLGGDRNLVRPSFYLWGEVRAAAAWSRHGNLAEGATLAGDLLADWKLTPSERFHARFLPGLESDGERSLAWGNDDSSQAPDLRPESLYFETDLGAMASSLFRQPASFESRLALGLVPIRLGQGLWIDDSILGAVVNSPWSLPGWDPSDSGTVLFAGAGQAWAPLNDERADALLGVHQFFDTGLGRFEWGLAGVETEADHLLSPMLGWSGHLGAWTPSLTVTSVQGDEASGFAVLARNRFDLDPCSPYVNVFCGDQGQALLRDRRRPGLFREAGICFAFDPLAPLPVLSGGDGFIEGAALGAAWALCEQQDLTFELAGVAGDEVRGAAAGLQHSWKWRADTELATTLVHRCGDGQAPASGLSFAWIWHF